MNNNYLSARLLHIALASCFIVSCQNEMESSHNDSLLINDKNCTSLVMEHAKTAAMDFVSELSSTTRSDNTKEVGDVYAWLESDLYPNTRGGDSPDALQDTLLYIVNFKNNGGYVLVHAKDSVGGILAYVEKGHLAPDDEIENPGFRSFLDGLRYYGDPMDPIPPSNDSLGNGYPSVDPGGMFPEYKWRIDSICPALTATKWGQNAPFNTYCYTSTGLQAVAGCVPISVAQTIAYYGWPSYFNGHYYHWSEILAGIQPTSSIGMNDAALLVSDIGQQMPNITYGVNSTTANNSDVAAALSAFGDNYQFAPYSYQTIKNETDSGRPVIIGGYTSSGQLVGHSWVLDGWALRVKYYYAFPTTGGMTITPGERQELVHCNWGWYGQNDGYFLYNVLDIASRVLYDDLSLANNGGTSMLFDSGLTCFYNISPQSSY